MEHWLFLMESFNIQNMRTLIIRANDLPLINNHFAMITKTQLLLTIESLPENLTVDQVIDHLVFLEKVQKGQKDSLEGKVFSKGQAKEKLSRWLK
jgi:hypothetical protein